MGPHKSNIAINFREDDLAVVIGTDSYVSHRKGNGPWRSTFSINLNDAEILYKELGRLLDPDDSKYEGQKGGL